MNDNELKTMNAIIDIIKNCNNFLSLCIKNGITQSIQNQKIVLSSARREIYAIKTNSKIPLRRNIADKLYRQIIDTEHRTEHLVKTILHG